MTDSGFHDRMGTEIDAIQARLQELKQERAHLGELVEERQAAVDALTRRAGDAPSGSGELDPRG